LLFRLDVTPVSDLNGGLSSIKIYPNPVVSGSMWLQLQNMKSGKYHIRVENSVGQLYHQEERTLNGSHANWQIQMPASMRSGVYIVHYSYNGIRIRSERVVVSSK
jgi:hypothetical protein